MNTNSGGGGNSQGGQKNHSNQPKSVGQILNQQKTSGQPKLLNTARVEHFPKEPELSANWLIVGVVAAVALICSGWLIAKHNAKVSGTEETGTDKAWGVADVNVDAQVAAAGGVAAEGEAVAVNDQPAGKEVAVHYSVGKVSWVAVRDAKTKWVLGARRFEPGQAAGTVYLLKDTVAGGAYEAVVYVDNGNKEFDIHGDSLVEDVVSPFQAQ